MSRMWMSLGSGQSASRIVPFTERQAISRFIFEIFHPRMIARCRWSAVPCHLLADRFLLWFQVCGIEIWSCFSPVVCLAHCFHRKSYMLLQCANTQTFLRFCQSPVFQMVALYDLLFPVTNITMFAFYRNVDQDLNAKGKYGIFTTRFLFLMSIGQVWAHWETYLFPFMSAFIVSYHDEPADQGNVQTKLTASNEGKWNILSIWCANSAPTRNPICGSFKGVCLVSWFRNNFFGHVVVDVSNLAYLRCLSRIINCEAVLSHLR